MRDYGKLSTRMWDDARVLHLDATAKLVFIYLLAGRETNIIGAFRCTPLHIAASEVCTADDAELALEQLEDVGLIERDQDTGVVLLPRFLRYNPICNASAGKAAANAVKSMQSSVMRARVETLLEPFSRLLPPGWSAAQTQVPTQVSAQVSSSDTDTDTDTHNRGLAAGAASASPDVDEWDAWVDLLVTRSDDPPEMVVAYVRAAEASLQAYYAGRNGRLTPTRRRYIAAAMTNLAPDIQLAALEIFTDRHYAAKDERYLAGIARRLANLTRSELEQELVRHRAGMQGHGLADEPAKKEA